MQSTKAYTEIDSSGVVGTGGTGPWTGWEYFIYGERVWLFTEIEYPKE